MLTTSQVLYALPSYHPIPDNDTLRQFVKKVRNGHFTEELSNMYGNISDWDVSKITDMNYLFKDCANF